MNRRRSPRIRLALGPSVPGWSLSLALVAVIVLSSLLAAGGTVSNVLLVALGSLTAGAVRWPGSLAPGGLVLLLATMATFTGSSIEPRTAGLVLGVHLLLALAAVCARITWRTQVELRVLGAALRDVLVIQVFTQALLATAAVLVGVQHAGSWLRWLGVAAALVLALLLVPPQWLTSRR